MEAGVAGTSQLCQPSAEADQQQSEPQAQLHLEATQDAAGNSAGNSESSSTVASSSQRPRWRQRLIRYSIAAIQAVLFLEVAAVVLGPLLRSAPVKDKKKEESESEDFDPADILMDYFTGRRGIAAFQLLSNQQLRKAVDNLVTEDFQELGIKDRGAEIRDIVDEIIRVREEGPRPPPEEERVGLGKLGPLKFKNSRPAVSRAAGQAAANSQAKE